jgi:hypothetical protein
MFSKILQKPERRNLKQSPIAAGISSEHDFKYYYVITFLAPKYGEVPCGVTQTHTSKFLAISE